jgi:vacuolar-type H+-ATPase subunit D/Vma8
LTALTITLLASILDKTSRRVNVCPNRSVP